MLRPPNAFRISSVSDDVFRTLRHLLPCRISLECPAQTFIEMFAVLSSFRVPSSIARWSSLETIAGEFDFTCPGKKGLRNALYNLPD